MTLGLQLLGGFNLENEEQQVTSLRSARLQSLLAYLAFHRASPQSRQYLAYLFWPDLTEAAARNNLRQAFHQLRHSIPNLETYLEIDASIIVWRPESPFQLDVADFESALISAGKAGQGGDLEAQQSFLEQALRLYQGELLPSCYDDWISPERERLHQQCLEALEQMILILERRRAYQAALPFAQRLLRHDRLYENGYRLLMRLYALNNDRASAIRAYHTCFKILQSELAVEPEPATQEIYQRLLGAEAASQKLAYSPELISTPELIGREDLWGKLLKLWQQVSIKDGPAAGSPRLVLLTGEAGVGKTRLAEELLGWVGRLGIQTARTRAFFAEGRLSYEPLIDWLRSMAIRNTLAGLEPKILAEIARLLPELRLEIPGLPTSEPLNEYWQRLHFFQALAKAVLSVKQPLLLLFDDLQWCDPESLEWLHYLLRAAPQAQLLIIATLRDDELIANPALQTFLNDLRSTAQIAEMAVQPLDAAETARMAAQMAEREIGVASALRLFHETEGNPLFILETMRAGFLGLQAGSPGSDPGQASAPATTQKLPPKVQAVISARLAQCSQPARELAQLAAVVGRAFQYEVLALASETEEEDLVRRLDELWQHRILRVLDNSHYDFSHDKLREVAYVETSLPRRRLLHRRVAEALEKFYTGELDSFCAQIAAHFESAGRLERAVPYYQQAASVASRIGANNDAQAFANKALELLQTIPLSSERDEIELELQTTLGAALVASHGHGAQEVLQVYQRAEALCQRLGRPVDPPILRALAISDVTQAEFKQALVSGEQMLRMAEGQKNDMLIVEANYVMGVASFWKGDFITARKHLEKAIACYQPALSHTHITRYSQDPKVVCLSRLAFTLWCLGLQDQAEADSQEALAYARQLAHPFSLAYAMFWDTLLQDHLGIFDSGQNGAESLVRYSREQALPYWLPQGQAILGWAQAGQGDFQAGMAAIRQGMETFHAQGAQFQYPFYLSLLAEYAGKSGDVRQGLALLDEASELVERSGERWIEAEIYRRRGELLLRQADDIAAEQAYTRGMTIARSQAAKTLELRAALGLARLWRSQGKASEAKALITPCYAWFSEGFETPDLMEAQSYLK